MPESSRSAKRIALQGGTLVPIEGPIGVGDLYLEGPRIVAVTPPDAVPAWTEGSFERRDLAGRWIMPGLVQTHIHLCQTLFRGAAERRNLYRWLSEVIWPLEAAHDEQTLGVSAEAGIRELLAGGTTCILDMGTTRHTEAILRQAARLGIRGFFGPALMDRGPDAAKPLLRPGSESMHEIEQLASRWQGHDGRLSLAVCPRFIPSVTDEVWRELAQHSAFARLPIHTHGSETQEEVEDVRSLTGRTPPEYFAELEGAAGRVKMAHGVWLSDGDVRRLHDSGTCVTHCPGSNMKLGSGLADVLRLRRAGVGVGLGADGAACNNLLSGWQEMRLAGYIQSVLHGPESVSAQDLLRLATLEGAAVLRLQDDIGSLRAGKQADLIVLDPERSAAAAPGGAWESIEDFLSHAGGPELVEETWVAGRCVFQRGENADEMRDLSARAVQARLTLAARAGLRPGPAA